MATSVPWRVCSNAAWQRAAVVKLPTLPKSSYRSKTTRVMNSFQGHYLHAVPKELGFPTRAYATAADSQLKVGKI